MKPTDVITIMIALIIVAAIIAVYMFAHARKRLEAEEAQRKAVPVAEQAPSLQAILEQPEVVGAALPMEAVPQVAPEPTEPPSPIKPLPIETVVPPVATVEPALLAEPPAPVAEESPAEEELAVEQAPTKDEHLVEEASQKEVIEVAEAALIEEAAPAIEPEITEALAPGEPLPIEAVVSPTTVVEAAPAEEERERPVEDRGGRPHIPTTASKEHATREPKLRQPKPEIVCWQRERRWILAVEVPEDLWEKPELVVHQNASPLAPDEREGHWRLDQVCGQVTVHWNEDEAPQEAKITLGEENYLLFKLSGQDQKQGRRVKSPSSGSYLVVVPESWERDEKFSGSPPVSVEGYQGHFFDLEKGGDKRIAFRTLEGKSTSIESKVARFELVGTELCDASEGIGPLFGKSPPRIRALHDRPWTDIGTIVVGEEGSKKRRWRKPFSPVPERREQDLPPEVAARKDGWYFLRFYDMDDDLVESLDFRLVCALREIKISQPSPFPSEGDHESVYVEFRHESGFVIQPADDLARSIQVESKNNKTTLTVPPEPIYDETRWLVGSEGKLQVQVAVLVERLWWAVGQESNPPSEWGDKLLTLACDDFVATSKKALWLRLPRKRWTDRVFVGFEQSRARPCAVKVTEKEISVPLRDFGDCQEMRDRDRDQFLNIWIERDSELVEGIVAIIPASKGPILCVERGKKKTAIATAVLRKGTGAIKANGQPVEDYFEKAPLRAKQFLWRLLELSYISKILAQMEVSIEVTGSNPGTVQQVKASAHALARALMKYDSQLKPLLKQEGFGGAKVTERAGVQGERQSDESNRIGTRD